MPNEISLNIGIKFPKQLFITPLIMPTIIAVEKILAGIFSFGVTAGI